MDHRPASLLDIPSYEIRSEIGRGATSVVYRASRKGQPYAIKVTRNALEGRHDVDGSLRFRREGAALAQLNHPGLVKVEEVGEVGPLSYLVMELVEGETLSSVLERGLLEQAAVVSLAKMLASALAEVHRHGLVHRDVKPGNVLIGADGAAKLLDFGFVTRAADTHSAEGQALGTFLYAPPEQTGMLKRAVDGRADLYSLGAVLFECATGRPPFSAPNAAELIRLHAMQAAPELRERNPAVSAALSAIVGKLLAKDPDDRYQTGEGLLADLENLPALEASAARGALRLGTRDARRRLGLDVPILGRSEELAKLRGLWVRTSAGEGGLAAIVGEAGSGKTRLTRELIELAKADGALVLSGKCNAADKLPLGALREAVNDFLSRTSRLASQEQEQIHQLLREAAGVDARFVRRLSPALDRVLGAAQDVVPLNPTHDVERFHEGLAGFLCRLASQAGRMVLLVDDAQWADAATLKVLQPLFEQATKAPLLVLCTVRAEDRESAAAKAIVGAGTTVELKALSDESSRALIQALLGSKPVDASIADRLVNLARGNPFALGTYASAVIESGAVVPVAGAWKGDPAKLSALDLPADVVKLVLARLDRISGKASKLLAMGAVSGGRFATALLAQVSRSSEEEVLTSMQEALAAHLIEVADADHFTFVHDRVREALLSQFTPESLKDAHQSLAEALHARPLSRDDLFAVARHFARGYRERNPFAVFETSVNAGRQAAEQFSHQEAHDFFTVALDVSAMVKPERVHLRNLRIGLAQVCGILGRHQEGYEHLKVAAELADNAIERGHVQVLVASLRLSEGNTPQTWEDAKVAFALLGRPFPKSGLAQLLSALYLFFSTRVRVRFGWGFGKAAGAERASRELLSIASSLASAAAYFMGRPMLMAQVIIRELNNAHFLGKSRQNAQSRTWFGFLMGLFGVKSLALREATLGLELAQELQDHAGAAWSQTVLAFTREVTGDTVNSTKLVEDALVPVDKYLGSYERSNVRTELIYQWHFRGYSPRAAELAQSHLPTLDKLNSLLFRANARGSLYSQLALMGRMREAVAVREQWLQIASYLPGVPFCQCYVHGCQLEVLVDREDFGREMDEHIEKFLGLGADEYHNRYFYLIIAQARLEQFRRASAADKPEALQRLKKAIADTTMRATTPVHQAIQNMLKGAVALELGQLSKAHALFDKAHQQATTSDNQGALFHIAVERARLARRRGQPAEAQRLARDAHEIARLQSWRPRMKRLEVEFEVSAPRQATDSSQSSSSTHTHLSTTTATTNAARQVDALLKLSQALVTSLDPQKQACATIDAIVSLLGAERGFLFVREADGSLNPLAGRDAAGKDLAKLEGFSSTVVRKVAASSKSLVVTGTDEGEVLGSQSAVAHDLRSIMAAPVKLRDELMGVVYIDSRLAKGLFTEEDNDLLAALASHIATALELGRAARVEAERRAMEKDLALTGAVQSFFIPSQTSAAVGRVRVSGYFQPAAQCAGDWWTYDRVGSEGLRVIVGDLTGHGAAPAMLTAAVASGLRFRRKHGLAGDLKLTLEAISEELFELTQSSYVMPLTAVDLDAQTLTARLIFAAGLPVIHMRPDGSVQSIGAPSSPLGDSKPNLREEQIQLEPGSRLLVHTDGLNEFTRRDGRGTRARTAVELLQATRGTAGQDAVATLVRTFDSLRVPGPLSDDVTFALIDVAN